MPIDFPNSPSTNQTYSSGGVTWRWDGAKWRVVGGITQPKVQVSDTPPTGASAGDAWLETDTGYLYVFQDGFWVAPAVNYAVGTAAVGTAQIADGAVTTAKLDSGVAVPTGSVMTYAGTTSPTGWLLCDGSEKAVATYPNLDSVLGTTYGSRTNGSGGAGSSHFRLPDLRGRVAAGKDDMGGSAASRLTSTVLSASNTLGATGGTQTHLLTGAESGTSAHGHSGTTGNGKSKFYRTVGAIGTDTNANHVAGWSGGNYVDRTDGNWPNSDHSHDFTTLNSTPANASNSHLNTQPTIVMNYIIKT